MTQTSVLFLDIDGVVNSERSVVAKVGPTSETCEMIRDLDRLANIPYGAVFALRTVDPVCVGIVNRILEETGAILVLSSTHRMHFAAEQYGSKNHLTLLRLYLTAMGFKVPKQLSITPKLGTKRGVEVARWLCEAPSADYRYAILDDGRDFEPMQPLVWCDPNHGISYANYVETLKLLGAKEPGLILL